VPDRRFDKGGGESIKMGPLGREHSGDAKQRAAQAFSNATGMMRQHGFDIGNRLQAVIDPTLPFMGPILSYLV